MSVSRSRPSRGDRRPRLPCGFVLLMLAAFPAWAIDIQVDVLGDPVPNGCTPGSCSLREAVSLANSLAGPDRILLPATPGVPLQLTIPGANENGNATGDLDVLDDLEIVGTGAATTLLVQTTQDRVLHTTMPSSGRLVLRGLTIQGGSATQSGGYRGGALHSSSLTTIEDVAFVGNTASFVGGAVYFDGLYDPALVETRLVLRRVRFEDNVATGAGEAYGGALYASSFIDGAPFARIEDCEFTGNVGKNGGGAIWLTGSINIAGGDVVISRSQFSANIAGVNGGGALMVASSGFDLRIEDSLFDANVATGNEPFSPGAINLSQLRSAVLLRTTLSSNSGNRGGALRGGFLPIQIIDSHLFDNTAALGGGAVWASSDLLVDRSTFESNRVTSTSSADPGGGAIGFSGVDLDIRRSTFSHNDAYRGGAISLMAGRLTVTGSTFVAGALGIAGRTGTVVRIQNQDRDLAVANSIFRGTCTFPDVNRRWTAAYNNIESPGNDCRFGSAFFTGQNQVSATSAQIALGPLADNGGPTWTRLPGAGSIAINQGRESNCWPTDQRHYARADTLCDIGAVEVGATLDELFRNGFD